jgi:hypothetical protein
MYILDTKDLDYEKGEYHYLPKIKVELNGTPSCFEEYEFFHQIIDKPSMLQFHPYDPEESTIQISSFQLENVTKNGTIFEQNRWAKSYLPMDLSGLLERGEEFQINIVKDQYGDSVTNTYSEIPDNCSADVIIEYCNINEGIWRNAKDVVFTYECHNQNLKSMTTLTGDELNHFDDQLVNMNSTANYDGTSYDLSYSANIKGLPKFRLCMPTQNELFSLMGIGNSTSTDITRKVNLNIEFTKVTTLVDDNLVPSFYSASWNANTYPSGLYFVKLTTAEFTQTQKIMLLK